MPLHPQIAKLLQESAKVPATPLTVANIPKLREATLKLALLVGEVEPVFQIKNQAIEGLLVRIYRPTDRNHLPVLLYFHPGGYVKGDIEASDPLCRLLTNHLEALVVAVNYRLAPDFRFPAPIEDGFKILKWLFTHAEEWGGDRDRIAVCGESSGGNLAAVLAHKARDAHLRLKQQILIYPQVDYTMNCSSHQQFKKGYLLTEEALHFYKEQYVPQGVSLTHPDLSPLFHINFKQLAPALVLTAEYDPLRDEGEAYALKLKEAGVATVMHRFPGMTHGFFQMQSLVGDEALRFIASRFCR